MYQAVTHGIRVRVTPQYLEEESSPRDSRARMRSDRWFSANRVGNHTSLP